MDLEFLKINTHVVKYIHYCHIIKYVNIEYILILNS
uniref:Uncharacterized protein n=1 Tax=Anguilla anguilla TaxID=7936 RepID=A0A0E9QP14_ANGAN